VAGDVRNSEHFLIPVKIIRSDHRSHAFFSLILLANRFNSAYDLMLNTGKWSGGDTSKGRRLFCVVEKCKIIGLQKFPPQKERAVRGIGVPSFLWLLLHKADSTKFYRLL
jgi:hypothetical protein